MLDIYKPGQLKKTKVDVNIKAYKNREEKYEESTLMDFLIEKHGEICTFVFYPYVKLDFEDEDYCFQFLQKYCKWRNLKDLFFNLSSFLGAFEYWKTHIANEKNLQIYHTLLDYKNAFSSEYKDIIAESNNDTGIDEGADFNIDEYIDLKNVTESETSLMCNILNLNSNLIVNFSNRYISINEMKILKEQLVEMQKCLNSEYEEIHNIDSL